MAKRKEKRLLVLAFLALGYGIAVTEIKSSDQLI